jgi:hypothetical protein
MKLHANARTCPKSRRLLVDRVIVGGWSVTEAALADGVSDRTVYRWLRRFCEQGRRGSWTYAEVFQGRGENSRQAVAFLRQGLRFFADHGVTVERVMSDGCMSSRLDGPGSFCDGACWCG